MDRPLIILDTETATLQGAPHLLEIGALRVVDGEVQETFEQLLCPRVEVEPAATAIHGITNEDVRSAPMAPEVLERYSEWAGDDWHAAHNAGFDTRVLGFEYARADLEPPPGPFIDSLTLARRHIPEAPDHKLETLSRHLDLEEGDHHRALADAVWCWMVLVECMERTSGVDGAQLAGLLSQCGAPMTVGGRRPPAPRMAPRLRSLVRAVRDEHQVSLVYGGESGAPATLQVLPRFLFERHGKGYLEAECLRSGTLKTYLLDRIRRVVQDSPGQPA